MKKRKKLTGAICIIVLVVLATSFVWAYESPYTTVYLPSNVNIRTSGQGYGYYKMFDATSYGGTKRLRVCAMYYENGQWVHDYATDVFVSIGGSIRNFRTTYLSNERYWLLKLGSDDLGIGATGFGWLWYSL